MSWLEQQGCNPNQHEHNIACNCQYGFRHIARTEAIRLRFYAISMERKLQHPAVVAVCDAARQKLFG